MKLAAVDIGSNAIRLQVTNVTYYEGKPTLKKVEYLRFPLRLGHDVFTYERVSPETASKFIKLMQVFKHLIDLYEVKEHMVCATSAMREAVNGEALAVIVKNLTGLEIDIISGREEAEIINLAIRKHLDGKDALHIDVGGGSTELNIYQDMEKIASKSFKIGSVRRLEKHDSPEVWMKMEEWLKRKIQPIKGPITAIGTGGNINKLFDVAKKTGARAGKSMTLTQLEETQKYIAGYTLEDRINFLQLNPDRADVILPASDIYLSCMKWAKSKKIIVPNVGLKDGMMLKLYQKHVPKKFL